MLLIAVAIFLFFRWIDNGVASAVCEAFVAARCTGPAVVDTLELDREPPPSGSERDGFVDMLIAVGGVRIVTHRA